MLYRRLFVAWLFTILVIGGSVYAQESTAEATAEATAAVTAAPETTAQAEATAEAGAGTTYRVQAGETLFRIARRYGLTVNALAAANGITNPNLIYAGQVLKIPPTTVTPTPAPTTPAPTTVTPTTPAPTTPAPTTPAPTVTPTTPAGTTTYIVQSGDTLFRIALRYKTTVAELVKLNNIANPNVIFAGQRLIVPSGGSSASGTPTAANPNIVPQAIADNGFARGIEVFIEGQDVNALTAQVAQLGLDWVKITVNWRKIEPNQGAPDFAALDVAVEAFHQADLNILLTLTGAPDWARPSMTDVVKNALNEYGPPDKLADFGVFAGTVAARYAGKVQAYEIWTQPNLRRTWISPTTTSDKVAMSDARYIDLLKEAYTAIKKADSAALVITGGLAPTGLNDRVNAIDDQVFLSALLGQGVSNYSDGIGAQPDGFANPPDAVCCTQTPGVATHYEQPRFYFLDTLRAYRKILNDGGARNMVIWVTRFGWGTSEGNTLEAVNPEINLYLGYNTPAEQATFVPRAFEIGKELGYVGPMFLYNLNGCLVNDGEACFYSMSDSSRAARPVFTALQNQAVPATPAPEATPEATADS